MPLHSYISNAGKALPNAWQWSNNPMISHDAKPRYMQRKYNEETNPIETAALVPIANLCSSLLQCLRWASARRAITGTYKYCTSSRLPLDRATEQIQALIAKRCTAMTPCAYSFLLSASLLTSWSPASVGRAVGGVGAQAKVNLRLSWAVQSCRGRRQHISIAWSGHVDRFAPFPSPAAFERGQHGGHELLLLFSATLR